MATSLDLGNLIIHLKADISQYKKEMRNAKNIMNYAARSLTSAGIKMSLAATVPITMIGKAAVKSFASFDEAITNSLSIMRDVTPAMRSEMELLARQLSTESVTAAEELAKAYGFLALAGLKAETQLKALPFVNKFAIAGAFDMATATDILTDAQSALGFQSKDTNTHLRDMAKLGDMIADASRTANDSIQGFATMITKRAGVAANRFNLDMETTLALMTAYANKSIKGSRAGNELARALNLTTKAVVENKKVWDQLGIQAIDKASGEFLNFIDIMANVQDALKDMTGPAMVKALTELGFQARSIAAIDPLISQIKLLKEWEQQYKDTGSVIKDMADFQMEAFNAQLEITKNQVKDAAREIGKQLAPAILWLSSKVREGVAWWNALNAQTRLWIVVAAGVVASIGPILLMLAVLIKTVAFVIGVFAGFGAILIALAAVALAWPLGRFLVDKFEWVAKAGNNLAGALLVIWEYIKFGFRAMTASVWTFWDAMINKIFESIRKLVMFVGSIIGVEALPKKILDNLLGEEERNKGKKMMEDAKKDLETNLETIGTSVAEANMAVEKKFEDRRNRKKEAQDEKDKVAATAKAEMEAQAVAAAKLAEDATDAAKSITLDDLEFGKDEDGLTQFGTGEAIGQLGFAGLTSGADNMLENISKQALAESKKQTESLAAIEENTEWS